MKTYVKINPLSNTKRRTGCSQTHRINPLACGQKSGFNVELQVSEDLEGVLHSQSINQSSVLLNACSLPDYSRSLCPGCSSWSRPPPPPAAWFVLSRPGPLCGRWAGSCCCCWDKLFNNNNSPYHMQLSQLTKNVFNNSVYWESVICSHGFLEHCYEYCHAHTPTPSPTSLLDFTYNCQLCYAAW